MSSHGVYGLGIVMCMMSAVACGNTATSQFRAILDTNSLDMPVAGSTAWGEVELTLTETVGMPETARLEYRIALHGLDLDPSETAADDVWGIHFHHAPAGSTGPHTLNIFGRPRPDDADVVVDRVVGTVWGVWDDGDENLVPLDPLAPIGPGNIHPGSSRKLSEFVDALHRDELFVVVHTWRQNGEPEIGGRIIAVPEPTAWATLLLGGCWGLTVRRMRL